MGVFLGFIYLFLEREGREKEGEKHQVVASRTGTKPTTQACTLTGSGTGDLLLCRIMPNKLSHTSQDRGKHFLKKKTSHVIVQLGRQHVTR